MFKNIFRFKLKNINNMGTPIKINKNNQAQVIYNTLAVGYLGKKKDFLIVLKITFVKNLI